MVDHAGEGNAGVVWRLSEAERLVARRAALGLSQTRLARLLGVDRVTLYRWETGRSNPPSWLLVRAALDALEAAAAKQEGGGQG
jgi:transcriptional regulator with XRE-family HTH domain